MSEFNPRRKEQEVAKKYAKSLTRSVKQQVRTLFETTQGNSQILKSGVVANVKKGRARGLIIRGPHYLFKQHFGFEGVRSNGIKLRLLSATNLLNDAITPNALEDFTTEIAEIRGDEVMAMINF